MIANKTTYYNKAHDVEICCYRIPYDLQQSTKAIPQKKAIKGRDMNFLSLKLA